MAITLNHHPLSANSTCHPAAIIGKTRLFNQLSFFPHCTPYQPFPFLIARAKTRGAGDDQQSKKSKKHVPITVEEDDEIDEELPWIQEKALDLVEFTGTVTQAIPGPRVGQSSLPWILAVPLAYIGASFAFAIFKTVKKFTSPRAKRKRLVNKNVLLLKTIEEMFVKGWDEVSYSALNGLTQKTGFNMDDILRKYIRYAFNERPFNPDTIADLIHLKKASMLEDHQVAEVLNEISRRIVKDKGPVIMDISGFTEKGFKRKLAVQALFGKIFYLSEIPEFCSRDSSVGIKEIFGVTDEDADNLRLHTLSESGDIETLEKFVDGEESDDQSSNQGD